MVAFKAFHSAGATLAGIETAHMIRKGQLLAKGLPRFSSLLRSQHSSVRAMPALKLQQNSRQNHSVSGPIGQSRRRKSGLHRAATLEAAYCEKRRPISGEHLV